MNFLVYAHWFISISISQLKYYSISVDQSRYATYSFAKYLYTVLPHDMILTKEYTYTSDEQV